LKSYNFETQKWVQTGTNEEISSEYWKHNNATYLFPNYPYVETQLVFLFTDGKFIGSSKDQIEVCG